MDSLISLLRAKDFEMPPEATAIKDYVRREFGVEVEALVRERDIVITGRGASLINSLRLRGPAIKQAAGTKKRLIFRII